MQLLPDGVVNERWAASGGLLPLRSATGKSAAATGPAPCTQASASAAVAPGSGAGVVLVADVVVPAAELLDPRAVEGEMGVSLPGWLCWV